MWMSETCRGHLWEKIIVKLFASSWYIFLTYIYDARSHLYRVHICIMNSLSFTVLCCHPCVWAAVFTHHKRVHIWIMNSLPFTVLCCHPCVWAAVFTHHKRVHICIVNSLSFTVLCCHPCVWGAVGLGTGRQLQSSQVTMAKSHKSLYVTNNPLGCATAAVGCVCFHALRLLWTAHYRKLFTRLMRPWTGKKIRHCKKI